MSPKTSFEDTIAEGGNFPPVSDRYHLYVGWFCPFAHRVLIVRALKGLEEHINISVVHGLKIPDRGGWKFKPDEGYVDNLYNSERLAELYELAHEGYEGTHSVPVLWDKQQKTIVNNESAQLIRILGNEFNELPGVNKDLNLYPTALRSKIDEISDWMQKDLNSGVYKAGFASSQVEYEKHVIPVFKALNRLETIIQENGGPYILGSQMTEVDIRAYTTIVRFDVVYVQHFKVDIGTIRHNYAAINKWMKNLYWNHKAFKDTTKFREIKLNYTKSHKQQNPLGITPMGPIPDIEPLNGVTQHGVEIPEIRDGEMLYGGITSWDQA